MEGWSSLRAEEDVFRKYRYEAQAELERDQEENRRAKRLLEEERLELRQERERNSWSRKNNWS